MFGSFRVRLTIWNVGILAFSLLAFAFGIITLTRQNVNQSINAELVERANQFSREISEGRGPMGNQNPNGNQLRNPDREQPKPRLPDLVSGDFDPQFRRLYELRRPRAFNKDGIARGPNSNPPLDFISIKSIKPNQTLFSDIRLENVPVRVVTIQIQNANGDPEIVQVATDLTAIDRITNAQTVLLVLFVPLALALATIAGLFLTKTAFKPIQEMTQAAEEIDENRLDERLPIRGDDELSRLAKKFNEMVSRLQEAFQKQNTLLENQKQFTADASHELRTPLTRIRLATGNALDSNADTEDKDHALKVIDQATESMSHLVNQLLLLARQDANQENSEIKSQSLTQAIAKSTSNAGLENDPRLNIDLPSADIVAKINPEHFVQILTNLLANSARHTPKDKKINLNIQQTNNTIEIQVEDQGEGIPGQDLQKVTERFYRVDSSRHSASGGYGLGLPIVVALVKQYKGDFAIQSVLNEGTQVKISLPR